MLKDVIRYILKKYSNEDIQHFFQSVWDSVMTKGNSLERSITVDFKEKQIVKMISKVPFVDYTTLQLPGENFETNLSALRIIAAHGLNKQDLGKRLSSSLDPDNRARRSAQVLHDLKLFSLISDTGKLTLYGEKYIATDDELWIRKGIMREPLMRFYLDVLMSLRGFGSRTEVKNSILDITSLIIRNSQGTNLIRDSVATKRMGY
ncbi:MAG: hypothetical protein KAX49_04875 [Halanaerobiales bacterium]|nr:hypothetical protein [Halanaerobiales bacterium]